LNAPRGGDLSASGGLINAASVSSLLLITEAIIAYKIKVDGDGPDLPNTGGWRACISGRENI